MIPRSLKASQIGLEKAIDAFIRIGLTQEEFAKSLNLCRATIANFLAGKLIDRSGFFKICNGLGLNPNEIFEPISKFKINQIANLRQWIFNDYSQLVACLEITDKAYIVFQINEEFREEISQEIFNSLSRTNIQADFLDVLLNYLRENQQEKSSHSAKTTKHIVNLSRWFQNTFEAGWSTLEDSWSEREPKLGFSFRGNYKVEDSEINCAKMVKQIDIGIKLGGSQTLALMVALTSKTEQEINILLQLHPVDKNYLPLGIQLIILDECGKALTKVQAREYDNWIQQQINGVHGDHFSVEVALDDFSVIEHFVI